MIFKYFYSELMKNKKSFKYIALVFIIFLLPFVDFLKNNINETDIILGKSFYILIFLLFLFLFFITYIVNFFFKNKDFFKTYLIVVCIYWLVFKHISINLIIKSIFDNFFLIGSEYSSEISLLILIIISIYISRLIYKNNIFFKNFLFIFFYLSFFVSLFHVINPNQKPNISEDTVGKINTIKFIDKLNNEKENIYFFLLDAMQPIKEFEKHHKSYQKSFLSYVENENYKYIHDSNNFYDNTTHSLSALFYLDKIFDKNNKLKKKSEILFPTLLRENNKSALLNNLDNLGYDFKWIGNFFALCPKFNLRYCLNEDANSIIDTYLYINFFRSSPLIQIATHLGYFFNFDFDKYIYFNVNDGMGRLTNYLSEHHKKIDKPKFYFVHHMSPHWPYLTSEDCSYKKYSGNKNLKGYKSAYLCNLKKIKETIRFLNKFDPNSIVIFQSDHNWIKSENTKEKKMIFNLIKINQNCHFENNVNLNNVNALRLIFSCITGNEPKYIKD